jgi:hypothetical protein
MTKDDTSAFATDKARAAAMMKPNELMASKRTAKEWRDWEQHLATEIGVAEREIRGRAAKATDRADKDALLAQAARYRACYLKLNGAKPKGA